MKNVTITLPDTLAHAARVAAAQDGKSLSRWLADSIAEKINPPADPLAPFDRWLNHPGFEGNAVPMPSRDERNERGRS